jgi:large subunit ribosomal protein L28
MARRCDFCGKQTTFGNTISHSHRKTKRKWLPNLVEMKARILGEVKKVKVCTKCLKKGDYEKVI